jgi:nucleotide-binding universal stress UspA family protein
LTERAERQRQDRLAAVAKRWLRTRSGDAGRPIQTVSGHLAQAPIIMAAVDLAPEFGPLADAIRVIVRRILSTQPAARLTCVNVLKTALLSVGGPENTGGENPYLQRLVELKAWARLLAIDEDRISFHILEAVDPAAALVDYANRNHVDHIVIGARGSSTVRRYLGSISSRVVAEAPCSVTVVRVPGKAH